jgi:hypothetical protein
VRPIPLLITTTEFSSTPPSAGCETCLQLSTQSVY